MLATVPMISKRLTFLEMKTYRERSRDSMGHSLQSRRDCGYSLFLYQNKTILVFFSDDKTIAAFDFNFCEIKSKNVGNNMSKAELFWSVVVGMACD